MSVMFLLVPALLLMAQMVPTSSIDVSPPKFCGGRADPSEPPQKYAPPMEVAVGRDGFFSRNSSGEAWARVGAPGAGHDVAALRAAASSYKRLFPEQVRVHLTAHPHARYELLIDALDAVRGDGCRLAGIHRGEEPSEDCLLWVPIISASGSGFVDPADASS